MDGLFKLASGRVSKLMLILVLLFLYTPILYMIVYAFNSSTLVSVWGGFSTKWFGAIFSDRQLIDSLLLSIKIGVITAIGATVLGSFAGYVLARFPVFRGQYLFSGLMLAPMVLPEVMLGIAMLLIFVTLKQWIGWPQQRGLVTVSLAHITFAACYVAVIVRSRLLSIDSAQEEAALDLGATPTMVIFDIVIPTIAPAMLAGALLAFTLSIDNVVISTFSTGPGATTLPLYIFSQIRVGVTPVFNALATLIIMVVATVVLAAALLVTRKRSGALAPSGDS